MEIKKVYNHKETESKIYQFWLDNDLFTADVSSSKTPYTIVIPPPNITGILTLGHVLNNTIQDIFIRWKRISGYEACWIPGTDHAGIATQNVVEKELLKKGISKKDIGREKFVEYVWEWKEKYGSTIIKQLKKLGCSCDWKRERFTLDDGLSNAVKEVFIKLYNEGLIYRGKYIVNWCPRCSTALSDDEIEYSEQKGYLYYIKYPSSDGNYEVTVATTRPETMLGDTAVAVHPEDERYSGLKGKKLILPLAEREIEIIEDEFVDKNFGTGAVKVTPAHDPNDFQMGLKHNLKQIIIMDIYGKMNENVPPKYKGLDRYEARKKIIEDLKEKNLLVKIEDHIHSVGHCYRCNTVIEPYLSDQWFVKMKPLAEKALSAVLEGKIKFYPEKWVKVYEHWINNIRDWCISRQLWWGHRIPAYYCLSDKENKCPPIISSEPPQRCPVCGNDKIQQDPDVLDTWFSSWLWPFSTLGWPQETSELKKFYPTDTLVTAPDIIFFWVARMIMAGIKFMGDVPFKNVYFTSLVRDLKGRKMSKSLGNSPDPLDIIEQYGADSLRFTITYLAPVGQDILFSTEKCEMGKHLCNKIWNAYRFITMYTGNNKKTFEIKPELLSSYDIWILNEYNNTISNANRALENFNIFEFSRCVYDFFWDKFCDWYLELIKPALNEGNIEDKENTISILLHVFTGCLKLFHPVIPFITEEIYLSLKNLIPGERNKKSIMISGWPVHLKFDSRKEDVKEIDLLIKIVKEIRALKTEYNIDPKKTIEIFIKSKSKSDFNILNKYIKNLKFMTKIEKISICEERPEISAVILTENSEIYIPLKDIIDINKEKERLTKLLLKLNQQINEIQMKLNDENFISKAPDFEKERIKNIKNNLQDKILKIKNNIEFLN